MPSSNAGPAAAEMKECSEVDCGRRAVARGLCYNCYRKRWARNELGSAPRVERRPEEQLSQHFDVRLKEAEASALSRVARATGKTYASLLREATLEYLSRLGAVVVGG